jgi:hypothetical protein
VSAASLWSAVVVIRKGCVAACADAIAGAGGSPAHERDRGKRRCATVENAIAASFPPEDARCDFFKVHRTIRQRAEIIVP